MCLRSITLLREAYICYFVWWRLSGNQSDSRNSRNTLRNGLIVCSTSVLTCTLFSHYYDLMYDYTSCFFNI